MTNRVPFMYDPQRPDRGTWTMYRGMLYPSGLEAAFAETFDRALSAMRGPRLEYQPVVDGTSYVPDFMLSWDNSYASPRIYFETKTSLTERAWRGEMAMTLGLVDGQPDDDDPEWYIAFDALTARMATIWDSDPTAKLVLVEQRPGCAIPHSCAVMVGELYEGLPYWDWRVIDAETWSLKDPARDVIEYAFWPLPWRDRGFIANLGYLTH